MSKTIAEKCEKCGGLKAGDLHQFSSCAMEVISRLNTRIKQLEARILMMSTIENNLRGGLKQLDKENARIKSQCGCYQRASEDVLPISEGEG